jgi:two-component system sensor histidine kinase DesK
MPFYALAYLGFVFQPTLDRLAGKRSVWTPHGVDPTWPSVATALVFLPLYFIGYRALRTRNAWVAVAMAGLCYALYPLNPFAITYLIYAISRIAVAPIALSKRLGIALGLFMAFAALNAVLGYPGFLVLVTAIVGGATFFGNHYFIENHRKQAALRLSHDEVCRLAALAERERIGRDLHDLLGHTLSLVALKSELAGKLVTRDPAAAERELHELTRVAREALAQVRSAVTGIRQAGLAAEFASARLLLESAGVAFEHRRTAVVVPPAAEQALAMVLREAVTNIQRHAGARRAEARLDDDDGMLRLMVCDDGRGGPISAGNGLRGMRERVEALGGRLRIESPPEGGACLWAWLPPLADAPAGAAAEPAADGVPVAATPASADAA